MTKEQLLAEVEDLLRTAPARDELFEDDEGKTTSWAGRAVAVIERWNPLKGPFASMAAGDMQEVPGRRGLGVFDPSYLSIVEIKGIPAYRKLRRLLEEARQSLRMDTVGPLSVPVAEGRPFDYFEEVRKIVSQAIDDLFFVDPYLDAEFVSRYLPQVTQGVGIRLLTARKRLAELAPAVQLYRDQSGARVRLRSLADGIHDRFVFLDGQRCFHSGASFKDGGKFAPTILAEIVDAQPMRSSYEEKWEKARVEIQDS